MPDRSSRHGLPDDWRYGSHPARGQHSSGKPADGYEAGPGGSHRAGFGAGPADGYGAGNTEALPPWTDGYGAERADGFGVRPGAGAADPFGNADPFGDGRSFGDGQSFREAESSGEAESFREAESSGDASSAEIGAARPGDAAGGKGFLSALFDFGFTSFVTPKVIKVLYTLITIGTVISALVFTIIAFKASVAFGVATLVIGDPLFILIVLAIYRVILEFFVVTFRVAEDIRALRERGDLGAARARHVRTAAVIRSRKRGSGGVSWGLGR